VLKISHLTPTFHLSRFFFLLNHLQNRERVVNFAPIRVSWRLKASYFLAAKSLLPYCRLASSKGIVMLSVTLSHCVCVCVSAALVSVVKVMCCFQCSLVIIIVIIITNARIKVTLNAITMLQGTLQKLQLKRSHCLGKTV